jgi:hypothetical protein
VQDIEELGFSSPAFLEVHFSQFGAVECVLYEYRRKASPDIAFILMESTCGVDAALRNGAKHVILQVTVAISCFKALEQPLL